MWFSYIKVYKNVSVFKCWIRSWTCYIIFTRWCRILLFSNLFRDKEYIIQLDITKSTKIRNNTMSTTWMDNDILSIIMYKFHSIYWIWKISYIKKLLQSNIATNFTNSKLYATSRFLRILFIKFTFNINIQSKFKRKYSIIISFYYLGSYEYNSEISYK